MIVWSSPIFGETIHAQRRYQEAIEERARRLEAERNERARLAAQEERSRIFRELHDIWAHTIRPTSCRRTLPCSPCASYHPRDTPHTIGR